MTFEFHDAPYTFDFLITPHLPTPAILGLTAIVQAGWLVDAIHRRLLHVYHALPPLTLAPCQHTALLAYAAATVQIPARTWKHVPVKNPYSFPDPQKHILLCLSPTLPPAEPLHGAPLVAQWTNEALPLPICNTGYSPITVPLGAPVAYVEPAALLAHSATDTPSSVSAGEGSQSDKTEKGGRKATNRVGQKSGKLEALFDLASAAANWSKKQFGQLKELLHKYTQVWDAPELIGRAKKGEHRVDTGDNLPISQPLRRVAWTERDRIQEEVLKMKDQNIIVDSDSPWSSPPVLVRKKDGSIRFCIDYRKLNAVTVADKYPLPRIDDVLDELSQGRFFSVIDLKAGYWQIPMRQQDAPKTAFQTIDGHYHFTVMPFGLKNAPATFQRMMDVVLSGLKWKGLMVYMDDIVLYSKTAEEHLYVLEGVLQRLAKAGLKINPKKTSLVAREVSYLGHVVSAQGIRPNPEKVRAVMILKPPSNVKEVRMFLGLVGYYRRFIQAFAAIAEPLYKLTRAGVPFEWGHVQQTAFDLLKKELCESPVLAYPRRDRQNIVDCDASDVAAGAVLMQVDKSGQEVPIQFASYTFSGAEQRWPTMEKEAYAVVWALSTFRPYLLGSQCVVRTDNSAAATLKTARHAKLKRWAVVLEEFDYVVHYRAGKKQSHVDALSRLPTVAPRAPAPEAVDTPALSPVLVAQAYQVVSADQTFEGHPNLPTMNWSKAKQLDSAYQALAAHLTTETGSEPPSWFAALPKLQQARFLVENGNIVYRGFPPKDRPRWLVPQCLRRAIVSAYHRGAHGAHLGVSKVVAALALRFYWPNMASSVKEHIRYCGRCQRAKAAPRIPRVARMLNRESLWSTVAFDFFGPLARTQRGMQYILVGIDHFSRWPEAVATRAANAQTVAEFLHSRILAQHGTPKELLTDHGSHFASQVISELCKRYKIRRLMSTPYTPQSNGIVERFMGYLKNSLITLVDNQPKRWDVFLPAILFAYRASPHPELGDTPFFLNKGYDPRIPELAALDVPSDPSLGSEDWAAELKTAREALEKRIATEQEKIRQQLQQEKDQGYAKGQLVLVRRTPAEQQQDHSKLSDKFDHPARITEVMPNRVSFRVTFLSDNRSAIVNRRNLRLFYDEQPCSDDSLSQPHFPVARVDV